MGEYVTGPKRKIDNLKEAPREGYRSFDEYEEAIQERATLYSDQSNVDGPSKAVAALINELGLTTTVKSPSTPEEKAARDELLNGHAHRIHAHASQMDDWELEENGWTRDSLPGWPTDQTVQLHQGRQRIEHKMTKEQRIEAAIRRINGETLGSIAKDYGVTFATIWRATEDYKGDILAQRQALIDNLAKEQEQDDE